MGLVLPPPPLPPNVECQVLGGPLDGEKRLINPWTTTFVYQQLGRYYMYRRSSARQFTFAGTAIQERRAEPCHRFSWTSSLARLIRAAWKFARSCIPGK